MPLTENTMAQINLLMYAINTALKPLEEVIAEIATLAEDAEEIMQRLDLLVEEPTGDEPMLSAGLTGDEPMLSQR